MEVSGNIAHGIKVHNNADDVPGDQSYEANFSEQVINKIAEHNFRKQEPKKITYLKPTKAALYGLNVRFKSLDKREHE